MKKTASANFEHIRNSFNEKFNKANKWLIPIFYASVFPLIYVIGRFVTSLFN